MSGSRRRSIGRNSTAVVQRDSRTLVERLFAEVYNQPDIDAAMVAAGQLLTTPENVRQDLMRMRTAFPDFQMQIEHILANRNMAFVRWSGHGTQTGTLEISNPPLTIPASGRAVFITGNVLYTLKDGRIETRTGERDTVGLLLRLGVRFEVG